MKKVLVATCVMAMTAFGITNASAQTTVQNAQTARASAFGVELRSSLLSGGGDGGGGDALIDRTGEAQSVLPPGGPEEDDVLSVGETGELALSFTGRVLADTRVEPTIRPILNPQNEEARGGSNEGSGLLGGELLGSLLDGGGDGGGGGGILGLSSAGAGTFQTQQLGGDGGDGLLGGLLGDSGDDEEGNTDPDILVPFANAQGYAVVENLGVANEDLVAGLVGAGLTDTAAAALADALLKVEAVQAEAVALCTSNGPVYDAASRIVDLNNDNVSLVDDIVQTVSDILPDTIRVNEQGRTADGGIFVNALRVTIGGDDLGGTTTGGTTDGTTGITGVTGGTTDGTTTDGTTTDGTTGITGITGVTGTASSNFSVQQVGGEGDDALIDLILGHAEVGAIVCAQQAAPPATSLVPTGDDRPSLPRTGGGLGVLPAILGLGLLGGALTAGRLALRARHNDSV